MDHLCEMPNDAERRKALKSLPRGLPATYERILDKVLSSPPSVQTMVRRTLIWVAAADEYMDIPSLLVAVSINSGDKRLEPEALVDEEDVLRVCRSLIHRSESKKTGDVLEFAHFSVKEFLVSIQHSERYSVFALVEEVAAVEKARACLTHLLMDDFCTPSNKTRYACKTLEAFPFRLHALIELPSYLRRCFGDEEIHKLSRELFCPSKPYSYCLWARDMCYLFFESCTFTGLGQLKTTFEEDMSPKISRSGPLHFAAMLGLKELCLDLVEQGCSVNENSTFGRPIHCALLGTEATLLLRGDNDHVWRFPMEIEDAHMEIIEALHEVGANLLHFQPLGRSIDTSFMALYLNVCHVHAVAEIEELIGLGAIFEGDTLQELVYIMRSYGEYVAEGHLETFKFILASLMDNELKLKLRALFAESLENDERNSSTLDAPTAQSALVDAVEAGSLGESERLMALPGASLNITRQIDNEPLSHIAAAINSCDIIRALQARGVKLSMVNDSGDTILHVAARNFSEETVEFLMNAGCCLLVPNHKGDTPWHEAADSSSTEILKRLDRGLGKDHIGHCSCADHGTLCANTVTMKTQSDQSTPAIGDSQNSIRLSAVLLAAQSHVMG